MVDEWLDFTNFVKGVSPKPDGNFLLLRIDGNKPFGPDNFKWQEHLKRKEGETRKEWYARKWTARQLANPSMERGRNLKRKYGITIEQYEEQWKSQNALCYICGNIETSIDPKNGAIRKLAVDHNHITGKIRNLLCNRCNTTIGKIDENIDLLKKMISYLEKHKETL